MDIADTTDNVMYVNMMSDVIDCTLYYRIDFLVSDFMIDINNTTFTVSRVFTCRFVVNK